MTRATTVLGGALGLAVLAASAPARANPGDLFGLGAHAPAVANAMVASSDPLTSAQTNPAATTLATRITLGAGYSAGLLALDLSGRDPDLPDPRGFWAASAVPFRAGRLRFGIATALHLPDQWITRVQLLPASEPRFVRWDNQPHRIVFDATAAIGWDDVVSVGAGATFFANALGRGISFRIDTLPGRTRADADLDAELPLRYAPTFGLLLRPRPDLRFGLRYTEEIALDVELSVVAQTAIPGTMVAGEVDVDVHGTDLFTPRELVLGASWDAAGFTLSGELGWQEWSALRQVASDVRVDVRLGIAVPIVTHPLPPPGFVDVFVPRFGVERRFALSPERDLDLRAGWSYATTPVPPQVATTSFADCDRHVFGLGAALTTRELGPALTAELALQAQWLVRREARKLDVLAPGGDFTAGGSVWHATVGVRAEL